MGFVTLYTFTPQFDDPLALPDHDRVEASVRQRRGGRARWLIATTVLVLGLLAGSCEDRTPTQLIFRIGADSQAGNLSGLVRVSLYSNGELLESGYEHPTPNGIVSFEMAFAPKTGESRVVTAVATLIDINGVERGSVSGSAAYVPNALRYVDMNFDAACLDVTCGFGQTCHAGQCVGACRPTKANPSNPDDETLCGTCQACDPVTATCESIDTNNAGCASDVCGPDGRVQPGTQVVHVAVGGNHSCAIVDEGDRDQLYCWGKCSGPVRHLCKTPEEGFVFRQDDCSRFTSKPWPVELPEETRLRDVALGAHHACAVGDSGAVYCWGNDAEGLFAIAPETPVLATDGPRVETALDALDVKQVVIGGGHSCVLTMEGEIHCWGEGPATGPCEDTSSAACPVEHPDGRKWIKVAAGPDTVCAIDDSTDADVGETWCWGTNVVGSLGIHPSTTVSTTPNKIAFAASGAAPVPARDLSVGVWHGCQLGEDGSVWCWGAGRQSNPALLQPPTSRECVGWGDTSQWCPMKAANQMDWSAIGQTVLSTCMIRGDDSQLSCWGKGDDGQLGTGVFRSEPTPVSMSHHRDWNTVSGGFNHLCGLKDDGTLWCWGRDLIEILGFSVVRGRLGLGQDRLLPQRLARPRRVCFEVAPEDPVCPGGP